MYMYVHYLLQSLRRLAIVASQDLRHDILSTRLKHLLLIGVVQDLGHRHMYM